MCVSCFVLGFVSFASNYHHRNRLGRSGVVVTQMVGALTRTRRMKGISNGTVFELKQT